MECLPWKISATDGTIWIRNNPISSVRNRFRSFGSSRSLKSECSADTVEKLCVGQGGGGADPSRKSFQDIFSQSRFRYSILLPAAITTEINFEKLACSKIEDRRMARQALKTVSLVSR